MQFETLLVQTVDNSLLITINRPEKLNALNAAVINDLSAALDLAAADDRILSVIITGSGAKAFVAGADISEFPQFDGEKGAALARHGQELVFSKIENFRKPVVAAVNGFALGGGCELAMACHVRIASQQAKFGQPEVNLGLIPGYGGTQRLVHLIGKGRATELLITGNMIDAEKAHLYGLVNIVTTPEELLAKTHEWLATVHAKAPLAVSKCLQLVQNAVYDAGSGLQNEINQFGSLFETQDCKEGVEAFLEKRKATFTGR